MSTGYNERLFSGSRIRGFYHFARYHWLRAMLEAHTAGPLRVVELGCFDGRALDYIPARLARYVGYDANWENGLDIGRERLRGRPDVSLIQTDTPDALRRHPDKAFNVAIALETLEHLPAAVLQDYLAELARVTDGVFLVSVPNEMGPVFLLKYAIRRLVFRSGDRYSFGELVAATLRQPDKIARCEHKGFSYLALIEEVRRHFDVLDIEGLPRLGLPPALALTIGIVARSRRA